VRRRESSRDGKKTKKVRKKEGEDAQLDQLNHQD